MQKIKNLTLNGIGYAGKTINYFSYSMSALCKKAYDFILQCIPGKKDFSSSEQSKFRFRKTDYLQYKDAKGKKWFFDALLLNDKEKAQIETFKFKKREYVCVITDQFCSEFTSLIWKEKHRAIKSDSKYGAYHINVYFNPKREFNKDRPHEYFDKNVKYEHTIMHKDNPLILFLSDYIRDVKPEKDTTSIVLPVGKENDTRFKLPDGSTPYRDSSAEDNIKLEAIIGETISSLTQCVNRKKLDVIVPYVRDQIHQAGFDMQTALTLFYNFASYNNTVKYFFLTLNADTNYGKQNQFQALDFNKLFNKELLEQVPKDSNITFSDIVEVSNKTRNAIIAESLARSNSGIVARTLKNVFRGNGERGLINRFLDVLSDCLIEIDNDGILTKSDKLFTKDQLKEFVHDMYSEETNTTNDTDSITEFGKKGNKGLRPYYYLTDLNGVNLAQAIEAYGEQMLVTGQQQGYEEAAKKLGTVIQENQIAMAGREQEIKTLNENNEVLEKRVLQLTGDLITMHKEYNRNIANAKLAGVHQGTQATLDAVVNRITVEAESAKEAAKKAQLELEKSKAAFNKKLGQALKEIELAKKHVLPIKITNEQIAKNAIEILERDYNIDIFSYFDRLPGAPTDTQIDSLAKQVATAFSSRPEQTIHVEFDDLNNENDKATKENTRAINELRTVFNNFMEQSKSNITPATPVPTPSPTPVPTPSPTPVPTPSPTPVPTPSFNEESFYKRIEDIFNKKPEQQSPFNEESFYKRMEDIFNKKPEQQQQQYTFLNPGYQFSHSSSNTSGEFSSPPPLKVYYPIKRNVRYRESI